MNEYTGNISRANGRALYFENNHARPYYGYILCDSIEAVHEDEVYREDNSVAPACKVILRSGRGITVEVAPSRVLDCL